MASLLTPKSEEIEDIVDLIQHWVDNLVASGKKPEAVDFNAQKAVEFMLTYGQLYQVGSYLVAYVIDVPWYGNEPVLNELLVLHNKPGGNFSEVTDFFEQEAKRTGCTRISTGTLLAANNSSLGSLYERRGYHCGAWQMCKEIG